MNAQFPKILIDTDAGHDDVLAMLLLLKSGQVDVLAITTVAGNSTITNTTRNAAFTLELLDRKEIPVFSGYATPLKRKLVVAVVHGKSGLDGADTARTIFKLTRDAHLQIGRLVRENPHQVTILTLGPLTNIARAFLADPTLPSLVKEIVMMGGAVYVGGNKSRVAEFNLFVDPEAAEIVFKAKVKKTLVPLDPCNEVILSPDDFEKLRGSALYAPIRTMMEQFILGTERYEGTRGAYVYDAIAAYYLLKPTAFHCELLDIVIETKGEHTFGMTVVEQRKIEKKQPNVNVALKIDRNRFVDDLLKVLKSE
jgi:inosine-uridine nucleoside N-ribohydrolase